MRLIVTVEIALFPEDLTWMTRQSHTRAFEDTATLAEVRQWVKSVGVGSTILHVFLNRDGERWADWP